MNSFPEIDPEERFPFLFDFAPALATLQPGTTIASALTTARLASDSPVRDEAPQNVAQGFATPLGDGTVMQWIGGCMSSAKYYLRCKAQASDGSVIVCDGILPVKAV